MLGYLGFFRQGAFSSRDTRVLQHLTPDFRRRLRLDRQLQNAPLLDATLTAVLAQISGAAFVLGPSGIEYANDTGRVAFDERGPGLIDELRAAARGTADRYLATAVNVQGLPTHHLLIAATPPDDPEPRLKLATRRFGLTPRQVDVLGLLARGLANKEAAANLGCAEGTIELHVTALLRKMDCCSRAQVAARFWTMH
jgi:DNA-binding NarL/FixJ family response regulator